MATAKKQSEFSLDEKKALTYKLDHPEEKVVCPRCGKLLMYKRIGKSSEARCETEGCIHGSVRGI